MKRLKVVNDWGRLTFFLEKTKLRPKVHRSLHIKFPGTTLEMPVVWVRHVETVREQGYFGGEQVTSYVPVTKLPFCGTTITVPLTDLKGCLFEVVT